MDELILGDSDSYLVRQFDRQIKNMSIKCFDLPITLSTLVQETEAHVFTVTFRLKFDLVFIKPFTWLTA